MSAAVTTLPGARISARSTAFRSSRMLPGQGRACSRADRVLRERLARHARARGQLLGEVRHQRGHVLEPLAQRRHLDRHDVQPVEQVLAEAPLRDLALEILVGRRPARGRPPGSTSSRRSG